MTERVPKSRKRRKGRRPRAERGRTSSTDTRSATTERATRTATPTTTRPKPPMKSGAEPRGRVGRYLSALLVVATAYWCYSLLVTPMIEPPVAMSRVPDEYANYQGGVTELSQIDLSKHFPAEAWQRNAKVLETKYGALVFGDDFRADDDAHSRLVLRPVTLLFVADGDRKRLGSRPIILDAPEGIEVLSANESNESESAFGIGSPDAGRLLGEVTIHRSATPGKQDGFTLVTRNVQIDEKRIATPFEVRFAMGPHYGVGSDLEITLRDRDDEPELQEDGGDDATQLPIESVELVSLDKFVVFLDDSKVEQGRSNGALQPSSRGPRQTPFEVTCAGPLKLSMDERLVTLERQVNIARIPAQGIADVLSCELLEVHFDYGPAPVVDDLGMPIPENVPATSATSASSGASAGPARLTPTGQPADDAPKRKNKFQLRKVVAAGYPVRINSPSTQSEARGDQLIYEMANSMLSLTGAEGVQLIHEGQQVHAKRVDYQFDPQNPKRLGRLWAAGPGRVTGQLGDDQTFTATWNKLLKAYPDGRQHAISLFESVQFGFGNLGRFDADQVHFYLNEVMKPPTAQRPKPQRAWLPDRLQASGKVQLTSPKLTVNTGEVRAWFQPQVSQPAAGQKKRPMEFGNPQQADDPKLRATGDLVQLKLKYDSEMDVALDELQVEGRVDVQRIPVLPTDDTFRLRGDTLWLGGIEQEQFNVRLVGRPARIEGDESFIESRVVTLDQAANRIAAEGAGTLSVSRTKKADPRLPTQASQLAAPVVVAWKEQLLFDGARITLKGGVRISGEHLMKRGERMVFDGSGNRLEGLLVRGIDLSDIQQIDKQEFAVANVRLMEKVRFTGRTMGPGNRQLSSDRIEVEEVVYNPQTHVFQAFGPGWLSSVRADLKSTKSTKTANSANPMKRNGAGTNTRPSDMHYARVEFQDKVEGNAKIRDMRFSDRVRCVYGKVTRWDEIVRDGTTRGDQAAELTCRSLQLAELVRSGEKALYINATGNIRIQSQQFDAHAARLTYDQLKDLMVLHGDPRGGASLRYSPTGTGGAIPLNAQRIKFWPKKMDAVVEGFNSVTGSLGNN